MMNSMSDDTIYRQEAIDTINALHEMPNAWLDLAVDAVMALPSAQSEIIRCRDCEHWDKIWTNDRSPDYHYCPMIDGMHKGDFYCADAERKTDE